MANKFRGEVDISLNDEVLTMRLPMGTLVELEEELQSRSLFNLVAKFENGDFSSLELLTLLFFGLKGGGWQGSIEDLSSGHVTGGATEAAKLGALLLHRTFSVQK